MGKPWQALFVATNSKCLSSAARLADHILLVTSANGARLVGKRQAA
jgi:hypothetical protein